MLPYLVSDFRWEFGKSDELSDGYYPKVSVSILLAKSGLSGVKMFQELLQFSRPRFHTKEGKKL